VTKGMRLIAVGLVVAALAVPSALGWSTAAPAAKPKPKPKPVAVCKSPTKFDFRLNWFLDFENGLYFTPIDRGWYKAACIDPQIQAGTGSTSAVQLVASGAVPMGVADVVSVIAGQAQGLPVTAVGVLLQSNPTAALIREDSLTAAEKAGKNLDLAALTGKTYGQVIGGAQPIMWKSLTAQKGFDTNKVKTVTVATPGHAELASGKVDFIISWWFIEPVLEKVLGFPVKVLKFQDIGQKGYGLVYIVNNDWLKTHAKEVRAFLEVTKRSMEFTTKNPSVSVDHLCRHEPSNCSTAAAREVTIQEYTNQTTLYPNPSNKKKPWLCIDAKTWALTQEVLKDGGVPSDGPGPEKAFTNRYLKGC
jgi:NitT/TauT family transport system substrate-binding protein